jgi:isoquinoline 1-oxidoreductase alpha subunit
LGGRYGHHHRQVGAALLAVGQFQEPGFIPAHKAFDPCLAVGLDACGEELSETTHGGLPDPQGMLLAFQALNFTREVKNHTVFRGMAQQRLKGRVACGDELRAMVKRFSELGVAGADTAARRARFIEYFSAEARRSQLVGAREARNASSNDGDRRILRDGQSRAPDLRRCLDNVQHKTFAAKGKGTMGAPRSEGTFVKVIINSETRTIEADPEMPLLWALRDVVGLTGTKFGCGKGLCGACTVMLDGQAVRSCLTPLGAVAGRSVTTIEGLHPQGRHPLQQAWQDLAVPQCGYCQPGQLMQAAALLKANPHPSPAEVDSAMAGNICRCGTYPRIRAAIARAASVEEPV